MQASLRYRCDVIESAVRSGRRHFYAVRPKGLDGPIKLGRTKRIENRLQQLADEIGRPVELLATAPEWWCPESKALKLFAPYRIWGEWFAPNPSLLEFIADLTRTAARCARIEAAVRRLSDLRGFGWRPHRPLALLAQVEREMARRRRWTERTGVQL